MWIYCARNSQLLCLYSQNVGILSFKRIGEDEEIIGQRVFFQAKQTSIIPNIQDYVVVEYYDHWWIGLVIAVESISIEAKIKFMTPHSPRINFFWPQRDDICWVSKESILKLLAPVFYISIRSDKQT